MLKKLLIPCFAIAAAFAIGSSGCSSSTPSTTGKAGSGGGTAGGAAGGAAGAAGGAAGTTGAAGADAGAAGTTGAAGADAGAAGTTGAAGADAGAAGTTGAAGADGGADGGAIPACSAEAKMSTFAGKIDAVTFCKNFLANCTGITGFTIPEGYATETACEASWTANTVATGCRSYHLCGNAVGKDLAARTTHCPHALGMGGVCTN
ncbi:MAG TPA: hypothetical protein VKO16_07615 [Polyangia bacterium]|nr:hypothetical protein [Polyangia bacterium]